MDMLQGAFESAWERPEDLQRALAELPSTAKEEGRRHVLLSYLEAMRGCLREGPEVGEGGAGADGRAQGRRKRRHKPRGRGPASGSDQEGSENEAIIATEVVRPKVERTRGMTVAMRASEGRCETAQTRVLMDENLLRYVIGFLEGQTARQRVKVLGQVGSVCRTLKEVVSGEQLWAGIVEEVLPLSKEGDGQATRARVVQYGRMLVAERRVWRLNSWEHGMWIQFDVFDCDDGLQLLSARGPLWADFENPVYVLEMDERRAEVHSVPFSAASRGYHDVRHYASRSAYWGRVGLFVRVTIGERSTGRKALLWEECKSVERRCQEWGDDGSFRVVSESDTLLHSSVSDLMMECSTRISLQPEDDQEGVDERDKLYRVHGGENGFENGDAPLRLVMTCEDPRHRVPSFIMSLLRDT